MRSLLKETTSHGYSQSQIDIIVGVNLATSILSLFSSIFIIINYFIISSLRHQLSYKLILWVAVSDLIFAIANCMGAPTNEIICILQGIILQFGSVASVFWVVAISWTINYLMNSNKLPTRGKLKRTLLTMHIIIWTVSSITTIIPLFTHTYGPAGGWCWFKDDKLIDIIWRYLLFYCIVWISIIYMICIYIKTWIKIKDIDMEEDSMDEDDEIDGLSVANSKQSDHVMATENAKAIEMQTINSHSETDSISNKRKVSVMDKHKKKKRAKALKRMILFPLILIIGYLFGSIRRITDLIIGSSPFWLAFLQILFNSLIPFFDALVYGLTKDVRAKDKQLLQKCCVCGNNENVES
eukprot:67964_1